MHFEIDASDGRRDIPDMEFSTTFMATADPIPEHSHHYAAEYTPQSRKEAPPRPAPPTQAISSGPFTASPSTAPTLIRNAPAFSLTPAASPQLSKKGLIRQFFNARPTRPIPSLVNANAAGPVANVAVAADAASAPSPRVENSSVASPPEDDDKAHTRKDVPSAPPEIAISAVDALDPSPATSCASDVAKEATTTTTPERRAPTPSSSVSTTASPSSNPSTTETSTSLSPASALTASAAALSPIQRLLSRSPLNRTFLSKYVITAELGSGGFGHALSAIRLSDNRELAVKLILKKKIPVHAWARDTDLGIIPLEVYILKRCNHANIVRYEDYYECERFAYLVMEMHGTQWSASSHQYSHSNANGTDRKDGRDVDEHSNASSESSDRQSSDQPPAATPSSSVTCDSNAESHTRSLPRSRARQNSHPSVSSNMPQPPPLIRNHSFPTVLARKASMDLFEHIDAHSHLSEQHARHIFRQIADAIAYLHSQGIVHRDLKDENIVIDSSLTIKLIDFGSAAFEAPNSNKRASLDRFQGTLTYASPEILAGKKYRGRPSDIWAVGVLLYTMLCGECPFRNSYEACTTSYKKPATHVSRECLELVDWMLEKNPERRPSADQVLEHRWVKGEQ
ncbi:kinase-like domain-containing protein [Fimicolochytrium jonesii]|uniref:kinase-like domain-containing protein n=1 Tax=Fimicolochytrium jonesii TaxID=1396493 RepID=UPI0022FE1B92|nr:kinase-like domain-containing protein [Fimicolochytrium jonesii]KAI8816818.1 kinase-like domain-containing protein [Fimicolochytrium jonesii]